MREAPRSPEFFAITGANAEKRQTALSILFSQAEALETQINSLKRLRPKEAEALADQLERLIERMEKLVQSADYSIDEVEEIIAQAKPTTGTRVETVLLGRRELNLSRYEEVSPPVGLGEEIYFTAKASGQNTYSLYDDGGSILISNLDDPHPLRIIGGECYMRNNSGREAELWSVSARDVLKVDDLLSHDDLSEPYEIAGQLYYNRRIGGIWEVICVPDSAANGQIVGRVKAKSIDGVTKHKGNLIMRRDDGTNQQIVFLDGTPVPQTKIYTAVGLPWVVNGDLYFIGQLYNFNDDELYLEGPYGKIGDQSGDTFAAIENVAPVAIDQTVIFPVFQKSSKKWLVWCYDHLLGVSRAVNLGFDAVPTIVRLNNQIGYYAQEEKGLRLNTFSPRDNQWKVDSREGLKEIKLLQALDDNYIYAGKTDQGWSIFVQDQQLLVEYFDEIYELKVDGLKIQILAKKDQKFVSLTLGQVKK